MSDEELAEGLAVNIWSASVVQHEPDWLADWPAPPDLNDWMSLLIEEEREPWRKIARKLIATLRAEGTEHQ